MPVEYVVTGMAAVISVLATTIAVLWRNHLAADNRERKRADAMEARLTALVDVLRKAAPK